jgi:hypothetical protein
VPCRVAAGVDHALDLGALARLIYQPADLVFGPLTLTAYNAALQVAATRPEHEAKMISDRTRATLAAAKGRGKRLGGLGGRTGTAADCAKARRAKSFAAESRAADLAPVIEDIRTAGSNSLRSIARELDQRGISAPLGGMWSAAQVRAALARMPASRGYL